MPFLVLCSGQFGLDQVEVHYHSREGKLRSEIEERISGVWHDRVKIGARLFDGPMLQYLGHTVQNGILSIQTGGMSYRMWQLGMESFRESSEKKQWIGSPSLSGTTLESSDGLLVLGRRRMDLDTYPGMISGIAGWVDPKLAIPDGRPDLYEAINRELMEERNRKG